MIPKLIVSTNSAEIELFINKCKNDEGIPNSSVFVFKRKNTTIGIDQIREIRSLFHRKSDTSIMIIIYDFDTARIEAQNALLKTLEDHARKSIILLIVSNELNVLSTIRSRSKIIRLSQQDNKHKNSINVIDALIDKNLSQLFASSLDISNQEAIAYCDNLLFALHETILSKQYMDNKSLKVFMEQIVAVKSNIQNNNICGQYSIDHLYYWYITKFI